MFICSAEQMVSNCTFASMSGFGLTVSVSVLTTPGQVTPVVVVAVA